MQDVWGYISKQNKHACRCGMYFVAGGSRQQIHKTVTSIMCILEADE